MCSRADAGGQHDRDAGRAADGCARPAADAQGWQEDAVRAERKAKREEQDRAYLERIKEERNRTITLNYDLPIPGLTLEECKREEKAVREAVRRATGGGRGVESVRVAQSRDSKGRPLAKLAVYVLLRPEEGQERAGQHRWEHAKMVNWSANPSDTRMEGRMAKTIWNLQSSNVDR